MALLSTIVDINQGVAENDGTGESIRSAFLKVDDNFSALRSFLVQGSLPGDIAVDFYNANVNQLFRAGTGNISTIISNTATIGVGYFTSNLRANANLVSAGRTTLIGNAYTGNLNIAGQLELTSNTLVSAHIIPTSNLVCDLGSPSLFFRNIYAQGITQINTVSIESDDGMLKIHANATPGDIQDVGIFGKFDKSGANSWSFFGLQNSTDNFVFMTTDTDVTLGNSVVYDGIYGNVQFGSQLLSNTTSATSTSTGALIVAGGAGIAGNVHGSRFFGNLTASLANVSNMQISGSVAGNLAVDGNITSGGFAVITTSTIGGFGSPYSGGIITGNTIFVTATPSTSTSTGVVQISAGGLGVAGNINAGAYYGPYFGNVSKADQPLITGLGTLGNLAVTGITSTGTLQATTIGVTNLTGTGNIYLTAPTIVGNIVTTANLAGNLGSGTTWWNTVFAATSKAIYADLAEKYISDKDYPSGTILVFGGDHEVTTTTLFADTRVAGAVSAYPAYIMNSTLNEKPYTVTVGLRGRLFLKLVGPVRKGDCLVTADVAGFATSVGTDRSYGPAIFAKSLTTDMSPGDKTIEAVII